MAIIVEAPEPVQRSASARPDGTLVVRYQNGRKHKEGKWDYLSESTK